MKRLTFILSVLLMFTSTPSVAKFYKYNDLLIKNYGEMKELVLARVAKANAINSASESQTFEPEAIEQLRDGLKLIFSRPDSDPMVSKLVPYIRTHLKQANAFLDTIVSLVSEAIRGVNDENLHPDYRASYLFLLNNVMSELKPQINDPQVKAVFEQIKKAKLNVPQKVASHLKMKSMIQVASPSDVAATVLKKN